MLKFATIVVGGLSAMGGWAVVTVMDVPEYFVAGQQYTIEFQVRQHGRTLLNALQPELLVGAGSGRKETIPAVPRPATGTYAATFTAPSTGPLLLTIKSGWGSSELNLLPQIVVAAGTKRPAMAAADRGRMLFVAKGCTICHASRCGRSVGGGGSSPAVRPRARMWRSTCAVYSGISGPSWARPWGTTRSTARLCGCSGPGSYGRPWTESFRSPKRARRSSGWSEGSSWEKSSWRSPPDGLGEALS